MQIKKAETARTHVFKFFVLLVTFALVLSGCSGSTSSSQTSSGSTSSDGSSVSEPGQLPIVNETVELEIMVGNSPLIPDFEENHMTKKMEEWTNVHINWNVVADMGETKPLLLASNDLPEVFASAGITPEEQITYGDKGVFVDMAPLIESDGYYIHDMLEYDDSVLSNITTPSGKIVSLPSYSLTYHMTASNKLWVNRDWMEKLNQEIPTTIDEFYNVLKAMKEGDPNGNGQADEIPLSGVDVVSWNSAIPYVMSAFIVTDNQAGRYFVQPFDGTVDVVFNKPEWREGLKFLNKLYAEGLLDMEAFTQDSDLRKQKTENNQIGFNAGNAPSSFAVSDSEAFQRYDAVPPLKNSEGKQVTAYTSTPINVNGAFTITSACKNPVVAFKWADLLYNEELNMDNIFGDEGVHWRYAEEGEIGINGEPALYALLPQYSSEGENASWSQVIHNFRSAEWRLGEVASSEENYYLRAGMETRLYDATTLYEPHYSEDIVPVTIYISEDNAKQYSDIKTAVYEYMYECTARFITGDMDINDDSQWDSYVNELENMGLSTYLSMTQEAIG